jgi:hypothetical protein
LDEQATYRSSPRYDDDVADVDSGLVNPSHAARERLDEGRLSERDAVGNLVEVAGRDNRILGETARTGHA